MSPAIVELVTTSRQRQGLPPVIEDPILLAQLAAALLEVEEATPDA